MYKSPINIITGKLKAEFDGETLKAIQSYGIDVNKEELIKALEFDREQYQKGYIDGYSKAMERIEKTLEEMKDE